MADTNGQEIGGFFGKEFPPPQNQRPENRMEKRNPRQAKA
jgi:hypothetical protein